MIHTQRPGAELSHHMHSFPNFIFLRSIAFGSYPCTHFVSGLSSLLHKVTAIFISMSSTAGLHGFFYS